MTRIAWLLVELASLLLEPSERTAVLGDLLEGGDSFTTALLNVLGLAARRQLEIWKSWQPWLALLGIAGVSAGFLSQFVNLFDLDLSQQLAAYLKYGTHYEMGVSATQDLVAYSCRFLALLFWTWTSSFVLGSVSARASWLTGSLFYFVVATSWVVLNWLSRTIVYAHQVPAYIILLRLLIPVTPTRICFLLVAVMGVVYGLRHHVLSLPRASFLAVVNAALLVLLLWTGSWYEAVKEGLSNGEWHALPWTQRILPFLVMSWPAVYIALTSRRQARQSS